MSVKELYEAILIEIDKDAAPNMLLGDFNYYANKAQYQYINKHYNIYDVNQQTGDDLHTLKSGAVINITDDNWTNDRYSNLTTTGRMATYAFNLPTDYFHLLNCLCVYQLSKNFQCYRAGNYVSFPAKRLTADTYTQVINNAWLKPDYKRPYYYIHNINTQNEFPYNPYNSTTKEGNDVPEIFPTGNNSLSDVYIIPEF